MSNNNGASSASTIINLGGCRTTKKKTLVAGAGTPSNLLASLALGATTRDVVVELTIADPTKVIPKNNRRNVVRIYNAANVEVAKVSASITKVVDLAGDFVTYKLVGQSVNLPIASTYSVVWSFVAATPTNSYVESTETLIIP